MGQGVFERRAEKEDFLLFFFRCLKGKKLVKLLCVLYDRVRYHLNHGGDRGNNYGR